MNLAINHVSSSVQSIQPSLPHDGNKRTASGEQHSNRVRRSSPTPERTNAEREQLILEHLPQVRLIARRIHEKLPSRINYEDLVSAGVVGLIGAIDRFDPARNVMLKTYAECKIRGAILDSLRSLDWAPRRERKQYKQIQAAVAKAEQRLFREPTEEEIAQALNLTLEEYRRRLIDIRGVNLQDLQTSRPGDEARNQLECIAGAEEEWPSRLLERVEQQRLLTGAIARMPHNERIVINLYYQAELTLRQIARIVNLHESRVSQLKSQAIIRLRSYMEKRWPAERSA